VRSKTWFGVSFWGERSDEGRHILTLVDNLSVPFDGRVGQESRARIAAGFPVTVICSAGVNRDTARDVVLDGVRILCDPLRAATGRPVGYGREYTLVLWHTTRLALKVRPAGRIDVVHACNPSDPLFLVARRLRPSGWRFVFEHDPLFVVARRLRPSGWRFVFDHDDGVPEVLDSRSPAVEGY
jgi:hypothetical protein